jgi:hypothetical protein
MQQNGRASEAFSKLCNIPSPWHWGPLPLSTYKVHFALHDKLPQPPRLTPNVDESFQAVSRRLHRFMRHSKRVTRISFSYEKGSRGSFDNYSLIIPADELLLQKVCAYLLVETEAITSAEWMDKSCVMSLRRVPQIRHFLGNVKSSSRSNNFLVADGNTTCILSTETTYVAHMIQRVTLLIWCAGTVVW